MCLCVVLNDTSMTTKLLTPTNERGVREGVGTAVPWYWEQISPRHHAATFDVPPVGGPDREGLRDAGYVLKVSRTWCRGRYDGPWNEKNGMGSWWTYGFWWILQPALGVASIHVQNEREMKIGMELARYRVTVSVPEKRFVACRSQTDLSGISLVEQFDGREQFPLSRKKRRRKRTGENREVWMYNAN